MLYSHEKTWMLPEKYENQKELLGIIKSIVSKEKWNEWEDKSRKEDPPPDFVYPKGKLMMEVMRIDDHSRINEKGKITNHLNILESKKQNEIAALQKNNLFPVCKNGIIMNLVSDLTSLEDHNYDNYLDSFKWTINKHKSKIELYRSNNPDYKLIFFIFDESTQYIVADSKEIASKGVVQGKQYILEPKIIHFPFMDKRFIECIDNAEVDYILWFMPFKHIECENKLTLPNFAAIDVKHINKLLLGDYPIEKMMSFEE